MRTITRKLMALVMFVAVLTPVKGAELCTLIVHAQTSQVAFERGDCDTRITPASTFKVPLAVIGYAEGFLRSPTDPVLSFQPGDPDWVAQWKQDTNPTSWMIHSNLWYSQRIAAALTAPKLASFLAAIDYGNGDISGDQGQNNGLKRSWISSSLKISPREQARFFRNLLYRQLPVSGSAQASALGLIQPGGAVKAWSIAGKTGSAYPRRADGSFDYARGWGWYAGYAQKGDETYVLVRLDQASERHSGSYGAKVRDALLADMASMEIFSRP